MKPIIQNITTEKLVDFTVEEATWFNGEMNAPVKTYRFNYPSSLGTIEVIGEYRRNTWQKPNWYKSIHYTDIYLWTINLNSDVTLPDLEIDKNSWIKRKFFNRPELNVTCGNQELKKSLENSPYLKDLLGGGNENISATIRAQGKKMWTSFNTLIDHEGLIRIALISMEDIEDKIKAIVNIG